MESTREHLKTEIRQLLVSVSGIKTFTSENITDDMPLFGEGLGLDSIDILELVVGLDKKYGLKIRNDAEGRALLQNINAIVDGIITLKS